MKPELKKLLVLNLPYLLFVYLFAKCGQAYRLAAGVDASAKLLHLTNGISVAFASPLPSLHLFDLCVGVAGAVAVRLIVYSKGKNAKKYRKGEEYGSARWGTAKDIAPYIDPKFENNILLTQTERLTMTGRPKDPKTARNKNVLVIGGSGSGKTRFYVKPNLMQCFPTSDYPTSFVVTDPKGTLVLETGQMFQRAGYRVKILNTINFSKSMKYNPFVYIHSEKDVLKLVNTLIANTKGEGEKSAEDFWVKSERLFYTALIGYIWYEAPAEEMNFTTLLEMINASEAREDDPEFQSPVDLMFERLEQKDPDHFAVRQYKKFLLSAGKTRSSILISCGARLAPFDIREVRELMEDDEMELDTIGDEKTVLFLIMSDTDTTFNFILAMLQSQLINLLYLKQHCNLSAMEQAATAALREGQNISPEQAAYYNTVVAYVQDCRPLLNQGQYNLPEPPKLADFDQSLQDYKAQVQAEIAQEAAAAGMTVEEYAAAGFEAPQQDSFSIYQLRNEDSTRDYRFEPYDRLQAAGRTVDKSNYTEVYTAPLAAGTTLEDIYRIFNVDYPADFKGHSLSVSDVVVLHQNGQDTAHYCDSVGFQQVPEFLRENPLRTAEHSTEHNENMIDGVLNNAPSLGELEAKAKAGEQISLTDLAAAVKAEEKAPKAKKSHTAKPKKPSIRAQLDAAKKEQSKQTPPREKTKELEV